MCCFLETLARFRADLSLIADLISVEDDYYPLGSVPVQWLGTRLIGSGRAGGRYADIGASEWIALLRNRLARACLELGVADLDASVLHRTAPRRLTQLVLREVYTRAFDGIVYCSKYGADLENWALFEPFQLADVRIYEIAAEDPDFQRALQLHRLRFA